MQREQKIGFTILIMIVGFAGAFCFRKPDPNRNALPDLKQEDLINQQIAELRMRPYLPAGEQHPTNATSAQSAYNPLRDQLAAWKTDEPQNATGEVPAPIGMLTPLETPANSPFYEQQRLNPRQETRPTNQTAALSHRNVPAPDENSPDTTHIVQPGETLSGISYRHFGSASKYLDLFEANRDQLSSPNDLRPGISLKIPGKSASKPKQEVREANTNSNPEVSTIAPSQSPGHLSRNTDEEENPSHLLFTPARQNPFQHSTADSTNLYYDHEQTH